MIENLRFHIVFKRSEPGNSLIIDWIMKANKFFIFWSFNLIVKRREMEQNRFDTVEFTCFPRSKRSKIMQWLQLLKSPYLNQLSLIFQTCDAGAFLPSPRCSEVIFLGAVTASLVSIPKCWHTRGIWSRILDIFIISNPQSWAPVTEWPLDSGTSPGKTKQTLLPPSTETGRRGVLQHLRDQHYFIQVLRPW